MPGGPQAGGLVVEVLAFHGSATVAMVAGPIAVTLTEFIVADGFKLTVGEEGPPFTMLGGAVAVLALPADLAIGMVVLRPTGLPRQI